MRQLLLLVMFCLVACGADLDTCPLPRDDVMKHKGRYQTLPRGRKLEITFLDPRVSVKVKVAVLSAAALINSKTCPIFEIGTGVDVMVTLHDGKPGGRMHPFYVGGEYKFCAISVSENSYSYSIVNVAAHELLHCLGLGHDHDDQFSLMAPVVYTLSELRQNDIDWVRETYCRGKDGLD